MSRSLAKILILLCLCSFLGCAYYNTFYNAKNFYKQGEKERKKRQRTQVVELSPEEEAQKKKVGLTAEDKASTTEMQNYQKAIEKASKVLEFFPNSKYVDDALFLLGECFYYRREYKKAQRKFEEIIQLYPKSDFIPESRLLMAKTYLGLELFDEAERRFRELSEDPKIQVDIREEASFELAGLYFEKENYVLASENYKSSARNSSDKLFRALSLYKLGICQINLKQYDDAAKTFKQAVKQSPNDDFKAQTSFKLGEAQSLRNDFKEAIETFSDLLSKETDEKRLPRVKLQLANNLNLNNDLQEAVKWYNEIIDEHKRTDASARSYFALGEIEEFINGDYKKAKENYDLVRAEFPSSLIASIARERNDNIGALLDLRKEIARLEGREVEDDTTQSGADKTAGKEVKDDAAINLSPDGLWRNYTGRDRPPPASLTDLTEADLLRAAASKERIAKIAAEIAADSTSKEQALTNGIGMDSTAQAQEKLKLEQTQKIQLSQKYLALAQLLLFSFDKLDSARVYFQKVIDAKSDSSATARAMYSLGYIYRSTVKDTLLSESVLKDLIDLYPNSVQADGARKILGLPMYRDRVDSAQVLFNQAEKTIYEDHNVRQAMDLYKEVKEKYPDSPFAEKALYAQAWHYEKTLFDSEKAAQLYSQLAKDYPQSDYAKKIKPKLAAIENEQKQKEQKDKAVADSTTGPPPESIPQQTEATELIADPNRSQENDSTAVLPGAGADAEQETTKSDVLENPLPDDATPSFKPANNIPPAPSEPAPQEN